jgi:hypothetical protein
MATVLRPSRPSACATMRPVHANSPLRRLVPLAAAAVVAVALSACGNSSAPSTHPSGAGATHKTSTSTTASHSATSASSTTATPAPTAPTAPTAPAPQAVTFSPFTAQGAVAQGLQATQQVSGRCTSPGVAGAASYRCAAEPGDVSYDPCFAPPLATTGPLVCVPDPTVVDIIRFSVGALPKASTAAPQERVWAMRLQNGEVCVLVNAAWDGRGPFACPTPSAANSLADCRTPTQTAQGWSTQCQAKENAASPFNSVPVVNVWN